MKGFPPFRKHRVAIYCTFCHVEIALDEWPGHYRTKAHRYNKKLAEYFADGGAQL